MTQKEQHDTVRKYVADMLAVTKHIHEAIERQKDDKRVQADTNASQIVNRIDGGAVTGVLAGLYDKVRVDAVSKMLRDDYTALSLAAISQTMLHTTGLAMKEQSTASLAHGQLSDLTPLIVDLSELIPLVVARELANDGENVDTSVGPEARRNTQKAWNREVTG